jgi:hypothetical protein
MCKVTIINIVIYLSTTAFMRAVMLDAKEHRAVRLLYSSIGPQRSRFFKTSLITIIHIILCTGCNNDTYCPQWPFTQPCPTLSMSWLRCEGNGVTQIYLSGLGFTLTGSLPTQIGDLTHLTNLYEFQALFFFFRLLASAVVK